MGRLEGKVAIVTGAGRGIGRATALAFAKEGANVVVNDIDIEAAQSVAQEIEALNCKALAIKADVSKSDEVEKMVAETLQSFGSIDILVNNAGKGQSVRAEEQTEEEWDSILDTDLKGSFLCCRAVGKEMIKQKRGRIINIASVGAHCAVPGGSAYCAAKGGLVQLTKVLAIEWARYGINVNTVSPGFTLTPLTQPLEIVSPEMYQERITKIPLGWAAKAEDQANAVLFLASPESDHVTGQELIVDGGVLAAHPAMPLQSMPWLQ